jgi:hypothetical protein
VTDLLEARLRRHVARLAGEIGERHVLRPEALHAAERTIAGTFHGLGCAVTRQNYEAQGVDCANLEVTIEGAAAASEIVLAGAHYDTVPGSPGADDNASGVAAVLELARLLRDSKPARTIRLVAFVNEEPPFFFWGEMGSRVYARAARRRGDDIRVMLSLEMLGCYSDEPESQGYPPLLKYFYPERGDYIAFVSNLRSRHAAQRLRRLPRRKPIPGRKARRAGAGAGHRLERPALLLARGLSGGDGHRHRVSPLSPLPPADRHAGEARLRAHGAGGRRFGADARTACRRRLSR